MNDVDIKTRVAELSHKDAHALQCSLGSSDPEFGDPNFNGPYRVTIGSQRQKRLFLKLGYAEKSNEPYSKNIILTKLGEAVALEARKQFDIEMAEFHTVRCSIFIEFGRLSRGGRDKNIKTEFPDKERRKMRESHDLELLNEYHARLLAYTP